MVDKPQRRKRRALKRADDALYARKMPKGKWKTWGVAVAMKDVNGKTIMDVRGKQVKECIRMTDGRLANGNLRQL